MERLSLDDTMEKKLVSFLFDWYGLRRIGLAIAIAKLFPAPLRHVDVHPAIQ
jgi:hypothetical protein